MMFLALGFGSPTPAAAQEINQFNTEYSSSTAELIVRAYAAHWGVSGDELWGTVLCEDPALEARATGDNGLAHGLAQIRSDYHPDVTLKQANDPYFAINFMASYFAKGQQRQWTCWRKKFGYTRS